MTLQIVFEIHAYLVMKMHPVPAGDVVLMARVWEIVHLNIVLHTFAYETEAVLPYDDRVYCALADQKLALEVLCLVDQACPCITFRISFRMVHVTFSVHHFIPFPVDHRATCHSYLENVRIVGHQ